MNSPADLRNHFAGLAMQAYLSRSDSADWEPHDVAAAAYAMADAMLPEAVECIRALVARAKQNAISEHIARFGADPDNALCDRLIAALCPDFDDEGADIFERDNMRELVRQAFSRQEGSDV